MLGEAKHMKKIRVYLVFYAQRTTVGCLPTHCRQLFRFRDGDRRVVSVVIYLNRDWCLNMAVR
jgi:hypothetical protein